MPRIQRDAIGGVSSALYDAAVARIEGSPRLTARRGIILADWSEGDDHLRWVAEADEGEIVAWADQACCDGE
jgi:hypothetical protein